MTTHRDLIRDLVLEMAEKYGELPKKQWDEELEDELDILLEGLITWFRRAIYE